MRSRKEEVADPRRPDRFETLDQNAYEFNRYLQLHECISNGAIIMQYAYVYARVVNTFAIAINIYNCNYIGDAGMAYICAHMHAYAHMYMYIYIYVSVYVRARLRCS